jgi:hypothetical protein
MGPVWRALVWLAVLALFYALTEDQPYLQENVAAGAFAICGTAVVLAAATKWGGGVRLPPRYLVRLVPVLPRIAIDTVRVSAAILASAVRGRPLRGRTFTVPFEYGDPDDPIETGRRSLVTYGICVTPNTVLLKMDRDAGTAIMHELVRANPSDDPRWPV